MNYSNSEFILTEKEINFIQTFIKNNDCGAETPEDLLSDNYSYQCIEDLREDFDLSNSEIGGLLSSLQEKNVIVIEERDGPIYEGSNRLKRFSYEPDLYWVNESYLESLNPTERF